jgi:enoyl-[acyl-carrier-protein] reductase (NADH)
LGDVALFLASDQSRGLTGEILNTDKGFHIPGM